MGCNHLQTEDLDRRIEANLRGENCRLDPELEKELPEIRERIAQRCVVCLEENLEDVKSNVNKQVTAQEQTDLDKLDQEVWPTHQQLHEMVEIGEKLGVPETEVISTPLICATPGVHKPEELIRDTMWALHTQEKIPPWYRDDMVFSKIMFVDRQEKGPTGVNKLADFNPSTGVLHIFKTEKDAFPTKETIKWMILPHEIFHGNKEKFLETIRTNQGEWAVATALEAEVPSAYIKRLEDAYDNGKITRELFQEELAAEWFRRYAVGECSKTTSEFFDKFFFEEEESEEDE